MNFIRNKFNKIIDDLIKQKHYQKVYTLSLYIVYVLYILSYLIDKKYLTYITFIRLYLKYYVILFLIIKFNPLSDNECNNFDKTIIFQSAIFLALTTNITHYI